MKNKFASFIMNLVLLIIIIVLILFGIIIYQEIIGDKNLPEVKDFVSKFSNEEDDEKGVISPQFIDSNIDKIPDTPRKENGYSNLNKHNSYKYFYNQLNKYSKIIYDGLEQNKEQMKTGTAKIEFGDKFSELLVLDNGTELLEKYYQSGIETYFADNPDVFYIKPSKLYLTKETITRRNKVTYNVFIDNGKNINYFIDGLNSEMDVKNAIAEVEKVRENLIFKRTGNKYYDIKMVHDYLVDNVKYDKTISKNNIYDIYGVLVNNEAVCEGYAKAFKYLLDGLEIPSIVVSGKARNSEGKAENHAWNYVQLDNKWYAVDVTWDDPVIIGNGKLTKELKYKYFMKGEEIFKEDHLPEGRFTEGGVIYSYPQISLKEYR